MRDDYYTAADDPYAEFEQAETAPSSGSLAAVRRMLRGRWHWAILLGGLLAGGGGYLGYNLLGDEYTAKSIVTIKPNYGVAIEVKDLSLEESYRNVVLNEIERLESLQTAEVAMQQPGWQEAASLSTTGAGQMTAEDFVKSLELIPPFNGEHKVKVSFINPEPAIAQAGLNALLEAYRLQQKQGQNEEIDESLKLLQERKRNLELRERQIKEQMRLIIPDNEYLTIKTRLTAKLGQLANMQFKLTELELLIGPFLEPSNPQEQAPLSIEELMKQDPEMVLLLDQKKSLEDEYTYQTEELGRGPTMPNVQAIRRQISRIDRQILDLEASWRGREPGSAAAPVVPPQVAEMMSTHKALTRTVAELEAETNDMATRISAVADYELEIEQVTASIRSTSDEIDQFEETRSVTNQNESVTRIEIGDLARLPQEPSNAMKRIQFAGLGGTAGMGMGFGLVLLVGLMDRRLRHVSDTANDLPDTNVLGVLPTLPADLKDPEQAEAAAHCVHHIRTLLQIGGTNRVFSITSPAAGSGKSSLATALGMSFAATGSRTLVIDADMVGAGISRRMGTVVHESLGTVLGSKGMLDEAELARVQALAASRGESLEQVLLQEKCLDQEQIDTAKRLQLDTSLGLLDACAPGRLRSCVAATGTADFFVLPVGRARPSDASRLSPAAMRELVKQAREAFDIVLIDTGPVLGSLEASIAAAEADATVLIVSRGDQRSIATRSLQQLRSVRAEIAGLVFNHALESDLASESYASLVSQERRPNLATRRRKLDKTRSARLGPLGTAVASCADDTRDDEDNGLMVTPDDHANTNGQHDAA